eukprot:PhF_6_TR26606/c0_g1_i1/m.38504
MTTTSQVQWTNPLFGCDLGKCLYVCLCPLCAWSQLRSTFDDSNIVFNCLCAPPMAIRSMIRENYGIQGSCTEDIAVTCCCTCCAYVQTAKEVENPSHPKQQKITLNDQWRTSLYSCEYGLECLTAWFVPCIAGAIVRKSFDNSNICFNCLCIPTPLLYNIVREGYAIEGTCSSDCLVGTFCGACALHQMQREVKARGQRTKSVLASYSVAQPSPYGTQKPLV